jgi:hypothetical protein
MWKYALASVAVVVVGFVLRETRGGMSGAVREVVEHAAEALWATLYFLLVALLRPRWSTLLVAATSLAVVIGIERSQLVHTDFMEWLRSFPVGRLVLGTTFLWGDVLSLLVGTTIASITELLTTVRALRPRVRLEKP